MERWNRPLETRWDRLRAWSNMLFVDHGLIRYVYPNRHRVTDRLWRSAQPAPHHLHAFARAGGKSVVSLRGGMFFGSLPLEREACERAGLAFHTFVLRSRTLPSRDDLITAKRLFDRLDYPALIHCKSGADRVGFMSALYLVFAEGRPVSEARRQLSLRYGHIRQGKTGVLDAFFEAYERETGGAVPLIDWIETGYDRARVIAGHRPSPWGTLLTDLVLRRE
ncbi:MAG: hypothetical protein ACFBRM_00895 [Pikeienuella sp.]